MYPKTKEQAGNCQNQKLLTWSRRILLISIILGISTAVLNQSVEHGVNAFHSLFGGYLPPWQYTCRTKRFTTYLLSTDPLLIYIEDFVTVNEADHLIGLAKFEPSTIGLDPSKRVSVDYRKSWSAELPDTPGGDFYDPVVECVVDRASAFQGYLSPLAMETLQLVKYGQGEYYDLHYDAFPGRNKTDGNRESSLFVILRAKDVVGGATYFPKVPKPASPELCRFLDCTGSHPGLLIKPRVGSAIFWRNLRSDFSLHPATVHSGMKLESGEKIGANLWSWSKKFAKA